MMIIIAIAIRTGTMMYARLIPKESPRTPSKKGAPPIAIPAASELLPMAKSGRLSLKPIKRIEASANCIEMPRPMISSEIRDTHKICENQKMLNPTNWVPIKICS